jgi:hypothetical protein
MKRTIFSGCDSGIAGDSDVGCERQEKNELTGLIGRTFVSDQGVKGTSTPGALSPQEPA